MSNTEFEMFQERRRRNWVRLRTLVTLRWIAIVGQVSAIIFAVQVYNLQLQLVPAFLIIGSSVVANLLSGALYPENKRLSEGEALFMLVFDLLQLGLLLYIAGGLSNPFALLILAPVTIAATVLPLGGMLVVCVIAIAILTLISLSSIPIQTASGESLELPALFQFGFWTALVIGVIFLAGYARRVTTEMNAMGDALLATQLALAREQKLTDLGGVIAAAAHELGTPLATIKLTSTELMTEVEDRPELLDDAILISQQADRCRDILRSMGRSGKDDLLLRTAPLESLVTEAAEPHLERGKTVTINVGSDHLEELAPPIVTRRPEIIHGLRNLVQNAVDFAESRVDIAAFWTDAEITVRISDDGHGFPQSVFGRIGDPFVRRRQGRLDRQNRPGYQGMGLGLFIAKTLLERSGARLIFANGLRGEGVGAVVSATWPIELLSPGITAGPALGENKPITE